MPQDSFSIVPKPPTAIETFPDTERYRCRFNVRSSSSNFLHRISFDAAQGACYWTCSCRGNILYGSCKHLEGLGLKGRKFGRDEKTLRLLTEGRRA